MQRTGQPKRTGQKSAFPAWQSIHLFFLRTIPQDETILDKLAFDRLNRAPYPFVSDGKKSGERHQKETCVHRLGPEVLGKCFLLDVVAALANFRVNLISNSFPSIAVFVARAAAFLHKFDGAI